MRLTSVSALGRFQRKRTKQRREVRLPITDAMLEVIQWATPMQRTEFVLTTTGKPLSDIALSKQLKTPYVTGHHCSRSEVIIPYLVSGDRR